MPCPPGPMSHFHQLVRLAHSQKIPIPQTCDVKIHVCFDFTDIIFVPPCTLYLEAVPNNWTDKADTGHPVLIWPLPELCCIPPHYPFAWHSTGDVRAVNFLLRQTITRQIPIRSIKGVAAERIRPHAQTYRHGLNYGHRIPKPLESA